MTYIYSFTIKQDSPSRKQWKDHALTPCKQKQCIFDLGGEKNQTSYIQEETHAEKMHATSDQNWTLSYMLGGRTTFQKKLFSINMIKMPSSWVVIAFYTDLQLHSNIYLVFTVVIFKFDGIWIYYYKCSQIRYSNVLLQVKVLELVLGRKQKPLKKRKNPVL